MLEGRGLLDSFLAKLIGTSDGNDCNVVTASVSQETCTEIVKYFLVDGFYFFDTITA